ncbi:MAG: HAMP domain-containing sensor histidine kinase [Firmicutes bacterium]|nr:HAMP domain-containing sensor histidine kinase [Bacillota bacterium]
MKIAFIILIAAFALLLIEYVRYRRQVAEICRQLAFHHDEETNIDIRINMSRKEIVRLRDRLNDIFEDNRKSRASYIAQETRTKELIADVSHDIRTPLTSLDGYFSLLRDADSPEERGRYIEIITGRLNILRDLLEQLFTYAKLQNGSYKLEFDRFDCTQTMCEIMLSFYEEFRTRGINPRIELPEEECLIYGNKTAFVRIVNNILRNAIIHGRDSISATMRPTENGVEFIFRNNLSDSWQGDIDKVFERFYTADKSRTDHSSGLGLPVAKKLTEAMNGKISAEITDGDFVIKLEFLR